MGTGAELDILPSKPPDLAVAQAGLDAKEQDRSVPPSDPCPRNRGSHESGGLFFQEELYRTAFVAFLGDSQNALAVEGKVSRKNYLPFLDGCSV